MDLGPGLGHLPLQRDVPMPVAHLILQQAVAFAHGLLIDQRHVAMTGQKAHRHAVEKPAAPLRPLDPQPVHRGDEPQHPRDPAKRKLCRGLAVDAQLPRGPGLGQDLDLVHPVRATEAPR